MKNIKQLVANRKKEVEVIQLNSKIAEMLIAKKATSKDISIALKTDIRIVNRLIREQGLSDLAEVNAQLAELTTTLDTPKKAKKTSPMNPPSQRNKDIYARAMELGNKTATAKEYKITDGRVGQICKAVEKYNLSLKK